MPTYVYDYRPFWCKFCHDAQIVYSESAQCYIDIQTKQKHVCKKQDFANIVRVHKEELDPCSFCHSDENSRAVVYYKTAGYKGTSKIVVCETCTQKIFRALVKADEVES